MVTIRKSEDRGHFDHGWLTTYHSFSFAEYQDPEFMGYRKLRVLNDDRVARGQGFATHSHHDMEIITYVIEGALSHKDSMGNGSTIEHGDVQFMSAGTGVTHSEFNHSKEALVHLVQIWIIPSKKDLAPHYEQKKFEEKQKRNKFCLICSGDGREGSIQIGQDADIYASILEKNHKLSFAAKTGRYYWVQILTGRMNLNGESLKAGDGASVEKEDTISFMATEPSEFLVFDLA